MCLVGGLVGILSCDVDRTDRAEAILAFVFGVVATAGALVGYRIGAGWGASRLVPLEGYLIGLVLPSAVAGIAVAASPAFGRASPLLLLLIFGPAGAGIGAFLGALAGLPVLVAIGLVVGSLLGSGLAHALNVAIAEI